MKKTVLSLAFGIVLLLVSACKPDVVQDPEANAPEATFIINGSEPSGTIEIKVDEEICFEAVIGNTEAFTCAWFVGEAKVANTTSLTYSFKDVGSYTVRFDAENKAGSTSKSFVVNVVGDPLEVSYSNEESPISVRINEDVKISVSVLSGDKETVHSWKVDGVEVSTEADFIRSFDTPGTYTVDYFGVNRDKMTASHQWIINVLDLDLSVAFTPEKDSLKLVTGTETAFKAEVSAGTFGLVRIWTVGDVQSGDAETFRYSFNQAGEFIVKCSVTNDKGDRAEHSWVVVVEDPEIVVPPTDPETGVLLFDDFENSELGMSSFYIGNSAGGKDNIVQVVENPYKTASNPSSKVLVDQGSLITWSSSAYFKFKMVTFPDGKPFTSAERAGYDRVRVKIYLGDGDYRPLFQEDAKSTRSAPVSINGTAFDAADPTDDAWKALIKTNDWNVFVYDLNSSKFSAEVNNLAQSEQYQFRVCVDFKNNGKIPADVYFDDIELLESEGGSVDPGTGGGDNPGGGTDPDQPDPETPGEVLMFDDFENSADGVSSYYLGNNVAGVNVMKVVDNPYKTSTNSSSKVLLDNASLITWSSSGYFKFKINSYPDGKALSGDVRSKYSKVRVKVYIGETGFTPLLQEDAKSTRCTPSSINGIAFDTANPTMAAWNAAIKTNDWNTFVYDLTDAKYSAEVNTLAAVDQLQFRVTVNFSNAGQIGKDVYFDDIEFLP